MKLLLLFLILFTIYSCSSQFKTNNFFVNKIIPDSLIGEFAIKPELKLHYGIINLYSDNSCEIISLPGCYSCIVFETFGKWEIKGKYLILENNPKYKFTLLESKTLNNNYVIIDVINYLLGITVYKDGKIKNIGPIKKDLVKIPKTDFDSLIVFSQQNSLKIYNKKNEKDYFKISDYPINYWEFHYKLHINNDYSLKGYLNLKNKELIFFKISNSPNMKTKLEN
jgi:hypothetical protein